MTLLQCFYDDFLTDPLPISPDSVQEVFRQSSTIANDCGTNRGDLPYVYEHATKQSFSRDEVSAILNKACGSHVPRCVLLMLSKSSRSWFPLMMITYLCSPRESYIKGSDPVLSMMLHIVEHGRRPSRRERPNEPVMVIMYFKHWENLMTSNVRNLTNISVDTSEEDNSHGDVSSVNDDPEQAALNPPSHRGIWSLDTAAHMTLKMTLSVHSMLYLHTHPGFLLDMLWSLVTVCCNICPPKMLLVIPVSLLTKFPSQCFMYSDKSVVSSQLWFDFIVFMVDCCAKKKVYCKSDMLMVYTIKYTVKV